MNRSYVCTVQFMFIHFRLIKKHTQKVKTHTKNAIHVHVIHHHYLYLSAANKFRNLYNFNLIFFNQKKNHKICDKFNDRDEIISNNFMLRKLKFRSWKNQLNKSKRPSLLAAIFRTFWKELTLYGFVCFFNELVARLGQPLILGQLLLYFR